MLWPILLGLGLGISLAAPPGPMNALIANQAATRGPRAGIRVGLGAPVADVIFLAVLLFGVGRFLDDQGVVRVAAGLGAVIMAWFAWGAWKNRGVEEAPRSMQPTFAAALAAALVNPFQIGWWVSGGFVFLETQGWWGIVGLLVGIFGWVVTFSYLVHRGVLRWPKLRLAIALGSTLLLAAFAILLALVAASVV